MKKNLIALAVAAAFVAPAAAMAADNVTISGKVAADVTFLSNTGTTGGADNTTHQVNNNNSVVTLAGSEDLGNGNSAFFSLTYGLPLANSVGITGQNQIAGIGGSWGKAILGALDNPLKTQGRATDLFADQSTGDARYLTAVGAVEARANDVIAYVSPTFSGFTGVFAHSNNPLGTVACDGAATGCTTTSTVGINTAVTPNVPAVVTTAPTAGASTAMNILQLGYANGPLSAALGWHKVDLGTNDEKAWRLTGGYTMGALKFVGSFQKVKDVLGAADTDVKTWGLGAAYAMGATTIKGQYYKLSNNSTGVSDANSNMLALGVDYAMSKRTTLQAAYSKVKNDDAASRGGAAVVGGSDTYTVTPGSDPQRISVGMKHTF